MNAAKVRLPRTIWALGLVSLFMDLSSEIIHALLPVFLVGTLGASVALVGLIDGISESTASIVKLFSGYISDRIGRRKPLILLGYGIAALSKPLFPLAGSATTVLAARFADRIGKGIRGAPRDALITDIVAPDARGRAFGLRQAMDTVGAFLGPLFAVVLMMLFANDIRTVFWIAIIPAALAVFFVFVGVEDRATDANGSRAKPPIRMLDLQQLPRTFWSVVAIAVAVTLARFSESFLILKANDTGLPLALTPIVLMVMNSVYALGAYPFGKMSDSGRHKQLLGLGLTTLIGADIVLALSENLTGVLAGTALWGLHMALTQGLLSRLVADNAPEHLRGSAFGVFNFATGIAMLIASVVAGLLWDRFGPAATFWTGATFAGLAIILLTAIAGHQTKKGD
jgi:MFS family permease